MPMVLEMRRRGIRIDQDAAEQARDLFCGKRDTALKELSDQHGAPIGMDEINSPKWKEKIFDRLRHRLPAHTERQSVVLVRQDGMDGWRTRTGCRG